MYALLLPLGSSFLPRSQACARLCPLSFLLGISHDTAISKTRARVRESRTGKNKNNWKYLHNIMRVSRDGQRFRLGWAEVTSSVADDAPSRVSFRLFHRTRPRSRGNSISKAGSPARYQRRCIIQADKVSSFVAHGNSKRTSGIVPEDLYSIIKRADVYAVGGGKRLALAGLRPALKQTILLSSYSINSPPRESRSGK